MSRLTPSEQQLSEVLVDFARTMVTDFPIQAILDHLVQRIVSILPITAAGVTLVSPEYGPRYVAASDESALRYEKLQSDLGDGPCLVAFDTGEAVAVADLQTEPRFAVFGTAALDAGLAAVFTFPLRHGDRRLGALDLYRDTPGPLDADAMATAQTLADVAASYLINAKGRSDLGESSQRTERLAAIVESSNDSIISWSSDGLITSWNSGSVRMYGYTADEAVGQAASLIVPHERLSELTSLHARVIQGEAVDPMETQRVRSDGGVVDVEVSTSPLRDRSGQIIGLSGVARDISERKRAVEALRDSQDRKAAILASAVDAVVTMNHEGRIDEFNAAAERIFGFAAADVLGHRLADVIVPPELRAAHNRGVECFLATGEGPLLGRRTELEAMRADGTRFPAEVSIGVVETTGPALFTGFIRDITDRKTAEDDRRSLEDQLHQSQRLESLGQLAGGVAHDFNNLLAVILNYAGFVAQAVDDDAAVLHDVEQILVAARRGAELTRQLLTFARHDTARPQALDLNVIVDDFHALLSRSIGEHIHLSVHAAVGLPAVRADKGQTEQVLMNLVVNARDAMPDGGTITVETASVELDHSYTALHPNVRPGRYVRLTVSDDGVGMSSDVAALAFDPFFSTKAKTGGTGLGLAIVHGIVTEAGGVVNLDSEEGVGTTIRVYFPAAEGPADSTTRHEAASLVRGNGETVLVVEDQSAVREVTVRILHRNGYDVLEAETGAAALTIASGRHIDLLLTDVVMPQMSGAQLASQLRTHQPDLPVLYMSGYTQGVLATTRGVGDGGALIEKPFDEGGLLQSVHEAIAR